MSVVDTLALDRQIQVVGVEGPKVADVDPAEREMLARDAHESATLMALLLCLWGGVSLFFVPFRPFGLPNLLQVIVGAIAFVYFIRRRKRPSTRAAVGFAAIVIAYSLALLPWTAVVWCALGRPLEAFTVPQAGMVLMALVVPRYFWLGAALMALFAGECFFAYFYARHQGLAALIPVLEPWVSACFAIASVGLIVLRERRRRLRRRHIRVQAESAALGRIGPLFAHVRNELRDQLDGISAELRRLETEPGPAVAVPRMWRTVNRLVTVGEELRLLGPGAERGGSEIAESHILPSVPSVDPSEQLLRDRDAHLGATIFATIGTGTGGLFLFLRAFGPASRPSLALMTLLGAATLAYLVASWRRPSERRALAIVLFLWGTGLAIASYHQWQPLALGRPYAPFLGHKLLLLTLPIAAASRLRVSLVLIVLTALSAVVLFFALHLGAHKDIVPLAEPWVTLVFGLTAVAVALADEQRRVASLEILRAEAQNAALHRYAGLMLALRDQLNSPLQTMMLCAPQLELRYQAQAVAPIFAAVTRLTTLSRELADLDHLVPSEAHRAAVDAAEELRRRV